MEKEIKAPLLSVGDVIYAKNHYEISGKYTVERVTKTQAISGNYRWRIETYGGGTRAKLIGETYGWNSNSYYLETPELKKEQWRQTAIRKLKGIDYSKMSDTVIEKLLEII